ncbi:hypothetical protein [Burkholderia perseverans]|nr:hypothetical protein [Burkholderia perseverans]
MSERAASLGIAVHDAHAGRGIGARLMRERPVAAAAAPPPLAPAMRRG